MVRLLTFASLAALALSAVSAAHSSDNRQLHRRSSLARRNNNVNTNEVPAPRAPKSSQHRARGSKGKRCAATTTTTAGPSVATDDSTDSTTTKKGSTKTTSGAADSTATGGGDPKATGSTADVASAAALLPATSKSGWTVSSHAAIADITKLTLSDNTFITEKEIKDLAHPVIADPDDGLPTIHAHFDKGAYDLKASPAGGFSFYTKGPKGSGGNPILDMSKASEISFAYSVKFSKGYDFVQGGKLPGLYGGTSDDVAATCSGGNHAEGCFSTRFMFRQNGEGELYLYIPPSQNRKNLCGKTGTGQCRAASSNGKTYGASMGTGLWMFKTGEYTSVRQVIHLNTPGKQDGWAKVYVNGAADPVFTVTDISYRSEASSVFVGLQMQTFHGGHDPSWAPDQAQDSYFRDFSIAITE